MKIDAYGNNFSDKEIAILEDMELRENQLRNFQTMLNSSMPPKRYTQLSTEVLPNYITRARNAREKAEKLMKNKGYIRK